MKQLLPFLFALTCFVSHATTFTVTNTNDSGSGSLRIALQMAAYTAGPHTIVFNIPTSDPNYNSTTGIWVIHPATTYNYIIKSNVTIDGTTQTTNQGNTNPNGPEIVLDGDNNTINYCFSVVNVPGTVIKGFNIRGFMYGIQITGTSSVNSIITGNYIGTNETATDTLGNYIGIEITEGADSTTIGGNTIAERNIVSGNEHIGIRLLDVKHCTVKGNYVGVDRTGTVALPNYDGVSLEGATKFCTIGGTTPAERNIISGNEAYGLPVFGAGAEGNIITGNYIGTDVTGTVAIPNTYGVLFDDGSFNNVLGGNTSAERNILSGNSAYGVFIYNMGTNSNIVRGNFIGTDVNGTTAVPNAVGIVVDGAAFKHVIDSNVISGNLQQGIYIDITGSDSTLIIKNKIGVAVNGDPLGNGSDGIRISQGPKYSLIGGTPAEGNIIANNGGNGVYIMSPNDDNHLISCNSIYDNGELGIDLFPLGVNPNDAGDGDSGPNEGMNYPEIDTVIFVSGNNTTIISGTIDTQNPSTVSIQIYRSAPDSTGYGEGKEYLATVNPNISGSWADTLTGLTASDFLTTLAIDQNNNTSEFSISRNTTETASVSKLQMNAKIHIYPNPTNGIVNFDLDNLKKGSIIISSLTGQELINTKFTENNKKIEVNHLNNGVYIYTVLSQNGNVVKLGKLMIGN